jgi:hypothetical protein
LEALPSDQADKLHSDLDHITEDITQGVSLGRVAKATAAWKQWERFCSTHGWDTGLWSTMARWTFVTE